MPDDTQKIIEEQTDENNGSDAEKLKKCEEQSREYLAGWQRAKADFINYKKEEVQRFEEVAKYATEDLVRELIAVIDSFDIGLSALEKHGKADKGVYMIRAQLGGALKRGGLIEIKAKPGEDFNPSLHDAVAYIDSEYEEGKIVEEVDPGYKLHEKVLRAAGVKVSKGQNNS